MKAMQRIDAVLRWLLLTIASLMLMALPARAADVPVSADEYWTSKPGTPASTVRLWVYRKQVNDGHKDKPLLFLVHGSSYSGKTMFDLSVPGRADY